MNGFLTYIVYRVFGAEEISQWESFDMEYRSGLLTKQGLLKRRKQLLLSIGLYYNFTKDEILRNEENNIGKFEWSKMII